MSEGTQEGHPSLGEEVRGLRADLRRMLLRLARRLRRPAAPVATTSAPPADPLWWSVLRLFLRAAARVGLAFILLATLACWGAAGVRLHAAAERRHEGLGQELVFLLGTLVSVALITLVLDWRPLLFGRVMLAIAGAVVALYGFPVIREFVVNL